MQVELISHFGNDNVICDVARVSYNKHASNYSEEQNAKLINYLVNHKHTSPFRHPQVQFRITCPMYVERQLLKHAVGISVNSISGRYVDFSDSYTKIKQFRLQSKSSKQGSGEDLNGADNLHALQIQNKVIEWCSKVYNEFIEMGMSKEQARTILPLNLNTTFIWTGSLLALFHLFNLRLKNDTQQETREVAMQMLEQLKSIEGNPFKESLKAFGL
jgi:thymidylate synthase (FAD)